MAKFGSLFDDTRGPPMIRVRPTYNVDPDTGRVDRGIFVPDSEEPLFRFLGRPVYGSSIAAYALLVEAAKLGLYATLLVGVRSDKSYAQIGGLSAITVTHIVYVQMCRPFAAPNDTNLVLLGDFADLGTFFCALLLLITNGQGEGFRERVGVAMVALELLSLVAYVAERLSRVCRAGFRILLPAIAQRLGCRNLPGEAEREKLRSVVREAMRKDANLMARAYGDRWLVRALGRGLASRPLGRSEQPFRKVLAKSTWRKVQRTTSGLGLGSLLGSSSRASAGKEMNLAGIVPQFVRSSSIASSTCKPDKQAE